MTATSPNALPRLVILAAGASSRLGFPKALAPLPQGKPLDRLVAAGRRFVAPEVLVVTGRHHFEISSALPPGTRAIENTRWALGRTGSLATAVNAAPGEDLLVAPVDSPRVPLAVFEALVNHWIHSGAPPQGWLGPFWKATSQSARRFGHPILIGRTAAQWICDMPAESALRDLRARCQPLLAAGVPHSEILEDLDTPQDFEGLCEQDQDRL